MSFKEAQCSACSGTTCHVGALLLGRSNGSRAATHGKARQSRRSNTIFWYRLYINMQIAVKQVLIPVDDVLSVLARAKYYLNEKDLDSAIRELNQLKGTAKVQLTNWQDAARKSCRQLRYGTVYSQLLQIAHR